MLLEVFALTDHNLWWARFFCVAGVPCLDRLFRICGWLVPAVLASCAFRGNSLVDGGDGDRVLSTCAFELESVLAPVAGAEGALPVAVHPVTAPNGAFLTDVQIGVELDEAEFGDVEGLLVELRSANESQRELCLSRMPSGFVLEVPAVRTRKVVMDAIPTGNPPPVQHSAGVVFWWPAMSMDGKTAFVRARLLRQQRNAVASLLLESEYGEWGVKWLKVAEFP